MPGRWALFLSVAVFLCLFTGMAHAAAFTEREYGSVRPAMGEKTLLAMTKKEADRLKREAAKKEAENAVAIKAFKFPERKCRLPQMPTDSETRRMTRKELSSILEKIKVFGRCTDKTKVLEYEAVKDLVVNRLGGTVKESEKSLTFLVTPNVTKEVSRLFNQVNKSYISAFTSYEVAGQRYNQSAQIWNASKKFKAEFELKNNERGVSANNP